MHFKSVTFILACAMATGLMASPLIAREPTEEYTELHRETTSTGDSLVYYGPASGSKRLRSEADKIEERAYCATYPVPVCSTHYTARNDVCDKLVTELQGDSLVIVGQSPRQICYEGSSDSNEYCCVSWHDKVPALNKGDLAGFANTILTTCTTNGVSGKISNVKVFLTCTDVCLSNRGTGC